uniref:Uncharacterized protein n=1 Tax=Oryza rufipogon TaxID=4529 RepID=A0A0E0QIL0_ORYRU
MFGSAGRPCYMFYASPAMAAKQYSLLIYFAVDKQACRAVIPSEINVPKDRENCQQINKNSTYKIQRTSTIGFGYENNASVIRHVRLPCTDKAELSYGTPNMHEDVTNPSTAELKRKCARERYPLLTKELKEDRNKKRRDSRKRRKDESIGFYKLTHLLLSKFGLFEHNTLLLLN